ncbi:hypothetical protein LXL04_025593 [Taraxacum kok-saghyz]
MIAKDKFRHHLPILSRFSTPTVQTLFAMIEVFRRKSVVLLTFRHFPSAAPMTSQFSKQLVSPRDGQELQVPGTGGNRRFRNWNWSNRVRFQIRKFGIWSDRFWFQIRKFGIWYPPDTWYLFMLLRDQFRPIPVPVPKMISFSSNQFRPIPVPVPKI